MSGKMLRTFILLSCCCSFALIAAQRRPQPGNYPSLKSIPQTTFDCKKRPVGYYADPDPATRCQVYHMCDMKGNKFSYLCPNGTLFHQQHLICAHWYQVNCTRTLELYKVNKQMFPFEKFDSGIVSNNYSTGYVVPFSGKAIQPLQSSNANKPVIHEVTLKESDWQLTPGNIREQNGVNSNTNLSADVHVPISSARAILQSFEQPFQSSSDVPPIITQLFDQTTIAPRAPTFRGRTKFSSSRSRPKASSTFSTTIQQSIAGTPTDPPSLDFPTDESQTGSGHAVFGTKSVISTDRPSVIHTSFAAPVQSRNKAIRNRSQQQPSKLRTSASLISRSSWEATLPLQPASSEREQFAVTLDEAVHDSARQQSTAALRAVATTTPWISLRASQWPPVRQQVSKGKVQALSADLENQSVVALTQAPFRESQLALEGSTEKNQAKTTKLTMTFPKGGFFKKYGILPLNEKCPLCNPYFLKNGQCFPCVTIR